MTTISTSTSTLSSLASLYASENDASAATGAGTSTGSTTSGASTQGGLTSDQMANLVSIIEGKASSSTSGLDTLLGQSAPSGASDLSSIIDAIQAQTGAAASAGTTDAGATTTATADQQKAAAMMQSLYATQQANLFTLLG